MKTFASILVVALFLLISSTTFAKSGCCSWHGGVCGTTCCDGTSFSNACNDSSYYCSQEYKDKLSNEWMRKVAWYPFAAEYLRSPEIINIEAVCNSILLDYNQELQALNELSNRISQLNRAQEYFNEWEALNTQQLFLESLDQIRNAIVIYIQLGEKELYYNAKKLEENTIKQIQYKELKDQLYKHGELYKKELYSESLIPLRKIITIYLELGDEDQYKKMKNIEDSTLQMIKFVNGSIGEKCIIAYGSYAIPGKGTSDCDCKNGYKRNNNRTDCVKDVSTIGLKNNDKFCDVSGRCECDDGYLWDRKTESCRDTVGEYIVYGFLGQETLDQLFQRMSYIEKILSSKNDNESKKNRDRLIEKLKAYQTTANEENGLIADMMINYFK